MDKVTEVVAQKLVGTSASDCEIKIVGQADKHPMATLREVAGTLHYMNCRGIEKVSHRRALVKAGRKALTVLENM